VVIFRHAGSAAVGRDREERRLRLGLLFFHALGELPDLRGVGPRNGGRLQVNAGGTGAADGEHGGRREISDVVLLSTHRA
jgi:hypothetical protein